MKQPNAAVFVFALSFAAPALAADAGQAQRIVISDEHCATILERLDVPSAEYKPGVDVRGNKVVSADLPDANRIVLPDEISFDIAPNLYQALGVTPPKGLEDTAFTLGRVKVKIGGAVTFNGKRLNMTEEEAVAEACRKRMAKKK